MQFKEFFIVLWGSTLIGTTGYLLFSEKLTAWGAATVMVGGGLFLLMALNVDAVSSIAASWGDKGQFRMEMERAKNEVYAKAKYVKELGEEMARFAAHTVATSGRFVGDDHKERMIDERERIRTMMKSLGSEPSRIAEVLDQIDKMVVFDLKRDVVNSVAAIGRKQKLEQKVHEQLIEEVTERLKNYDPSTARDNMVIFLKDRKVYEESVEKVLNRLDLFFRQNHL